MLDSSSPEFWTSFYHNNQTPWDLGRPTPVFQRLLRDGGLTPGAMIVLGAGRGYDARVFASHGFQVVAVDFALAAVEAMNKLADSTAPVQILQSDIFELPSNLKGKFDYVLEYTCFCAIDPARREEYADVVADLLKPNGSYIALAFPIVDRRGGPPYAVSPDELIQLLSNRGLTLLRREVPGDSVPQRRGLEELLILHREPNTLDD